MTCSVNYTHKRPLRGHCAPPLQKPSQSVCTFGLTSWGFMVKRVRKRSRDKMLSHYVTAPSFSEEWSGWQDSNLRPHRPERCALPSWATSRQQYLLYYEALRNAIGNRKNFRGKFPRWISKIKSKLAWKMGCDRMWEHSATAHFCLPPHRKGGLLTVLAYALWDIS